MKRSADSAELADPGPYLRDYFYRFDMDGTAECTLSRELVHRAEDAREEFKRIRLDHSPDCNGATTGEQKYNRRLANNRNSAAASRVFREVLKKEQEYALKRASDKTDKLELQVKKLQYENEKLSARLERCDNISINGDAKLVQENARLREKVAQLESLLEKSISGITATQELRNEKSVTLRSAPFSQENADPGSPIEEEGTPPLNALPALRLGSMLPTFFSSSHEQQ